MYAKPTQITMITIVTLIATITPFTRADSEMPIISSIETTKMIKTAGRLIIPAGWSHGQRVSDCRQLDPVHVQQLHHVARPAHRNGGRAHGVFQHQVPADDPRQQFAHGGVGVGVGAAGDRNHGGEFAVAHAGEGAADGRDHEREHHRRPGVIRRGDAGQREQARADDGADPQRDQVDRPQRAFQVMLPTFGLGHNARQRFRREQTHTVLNIASSESAPHSGQPTVKWEGGVNSRAEDPADFSAVRLRAYGAGAAFSTDAAQRRPAATPVKETTLKFSTDTHRPHGRSLRGFLPVRLRQLDQEQPHSAGPVALGPLLGSWRSDNREILHQILEEAAKPAPSRDADRAEDRRLLRGLHGRGGHRRQGPEAARARAGADPRSEGQGGAGGGDRAPARGGVSALFEFGSGQDSKDSSQVIAQADQGGLGLPDRDYYLKDDPKSVELRQKYVAHVERMFALAGETPERAKADAATVMQIETALAKASLDRVSRRDPEKIYHKMSREELEKLEPGLPLERATLPAAARRPSTASTWPGRISSRPWTPRSRALRLDDWKTYLTWHLLHCRRRRCCRPRSSKRTSTSTARR